MRRWLSPPSRSAPRRRGTIAGLVLALAIAPGLGCKKKRDTSVPEVWDDAPELELSEALAHLAPPWHTPARASLDNGTDVFWLEEPGSTAAHVRLLLPTPTELDGAALAVISESLRAHMAQIAGHEIEAAIDHRPGRIELALHGHREHLPKMIDTIAFAVGSSSARHLAAARGRLAKSGVSPAPADASIAVLTAKLLGRAPRQELALPQDVRRLSDGDLKSAAKALLVAAHSTMIVHSGAAPIEGQRSLERFAQRWPGRRKRKQPQAIAKLRSGNAPKRGSGRPLGDPAAPLTLLQVPLSRDAKPIGARVDVWLGRVIPTPTARERSLARLAQRLLQEDADARVAISGPVTLFAIRLRIRPDRARDDLAAKLREFADATRIRHQRQRLFQAAQLWLGARVVHASLGAEDWTALWSEAIDLADRDADIPVALAREAELLLSITPEALLDFQAQWLTPAGAGGWQWVCAATDPRALAELERLGFTETLPSSP